MAVAWDFLLTSSVCKQVNKHLYPWFVLQATVCRTARNITDGTHIGQEMDVLDQMLMAVKEMEVLKKHFSDVWGKSKTATPLLRGKPSKAEQIAVSQEMFQNTKANEKKLIVQNQFLFECLWHLLCLPGINCISSISQSGMFLVLQPVVTALRLSPPETGWTLFGKGRGSCFKTKDCNSRLKLLLFHCCHFLMCEFVMFSLCGLRLKLNTTLCLEDVKFCQVVWNTELKL